VKCLKEHNGCFRYAVVLAYSDELIFILGSTASPDGLVAREVSLNVAVKGSWMGL
jgi:hypothetical protein